MHPAFAAAGTPAKPIWFVTPESFEQTCAEFEAATKSFIAAAGFEPKAGRHLIVSDKGQVGVLFGLEGGKDAKDPFLPGKLAEVLPAGTWRFANTPHDARLAALAFALGSYRFTRYRKKDGKALKLVVPEGLDEAELSRIADAVSFARDLINTPANDMGPPELEEAARALAKQFGASVNVVTGDALLRENFPLIHAVGRAAAKAPRLIELRWGKATDPKIALVGKGVCFDSGGLDIKPSSGMLIMKKDMAGAATVLALARMIMDRRLKLNLRVLIPAVENSISGDAFRPLDVYPSRKGISVEVGNTDAEGRLVLADALAFASEETPELLIDMGTLTGAARVALGPDLPPFYTDDETLAAEVARFAQSESDPVWRMPLWQRYDSMLESKTAELSNVSTSPFAGSIICALFMKRFVAAKAWLHFDIYAWMPSARPGRPEGGECQVARALYAMLSARYG
jgi:leucyl aminopeptidase